MLINVDYKIASKVITKRFEEVVTLLINPDQTGFIHLKGRCLGQNIWLVIFLNKQSSATLQLDFEKAFFFNFQVVSAFPGTLQKMQG